MAETRYREQLGNALNRADHDGLEERHVVHGSVMREEWHYYILP
jgi:hypothetical protein